MGPVGRVPPTLKDMGTKSIWSLPTFTTGCFFSLDSAYSNGRRHLPDNIFSCSRFWLILETHYCACLWLLHSLKHEQHASSYSLLQNTAVGCRLDGASSNDNIWGGLRRNVRVWPVIKSHVGNLAACPQSVCYSVVSKSEQGRAVQKRVCIFSDRCNAA